MNKIYKNESGFSAVETIMALAIVVLIVVVGYMVYKDHHKTPSTENTAKTSASSQNKASSATGNKSKPAQHYLTIPEWGVRAPYDGSDTLSLSDQTCVENGDASGDTVNLGCQAAINSKDLADAVGGCTAKVSGKVGYFYRLGPNDNYGATNGSGYTPVARWTANYPGQYTKIGGYYYAFSPIGKAVGLSGAEVASSSTFNGNNTGCGPWQSEYVTVEKSVKALASKFEIVPN